MINDEKKNKAIIIALQHLNLFPKEKLKEIQLELKNVHRKKEILREFQLEIKKGKLLQKIESCKVNFEMARIFEEQSITELNKIEKLISLEILKNKILKIINEKKLSLSREIIENIVVCTSAKQLNQILKGIPNSIRIHISHEFKSINFDFKSIMPIYTPMGNKR